MIRRRFLMLFGMLALPIAYGGWVWSRGPGVEERLESDPGAEHFIYRDGWIVPVADAR